MLRQKGTQILSQTLVKGKSILFNMRQKSILFNMRQRNVENSWPTLLTGLNNKHPPFQKTMGKCFFFHKSVGKMQQLYKGNVCTLNKPEVKWFLKNM